MYKFVSTQQVDYPVKTICNALGISRSSYYEYRQERTYQIDQEAMESVQRMFVLHRRRYGSRRISKALRHQGIKVGRFKVRRLMKEGHLKAIQPKSFVPKTTNSKHTLGYAPNVLASVDFPKAPNRVFVGDITYLPTTYGQWLYLNVWIDLFSRRVVGWKLDTNMEEDLAIHSFNQAKNTRTPPKGLIVHTDRAGQYAGAEFKLALKGYTQSMSGADNPYDNAHAESFFSRFKTELLEKGAFESLEDAKTEVFNYIEMYYNTHRLHSSLGYLSPAQFELQYYEAERNT